tara:strand:- start:3277 stop:3657 length:381 start_codon:yes stop_codon:yes gene_type:complete
MLTLISIILIISILLFFLIFKRRRLFKNTNRGLDLINNNKIKIRNKFYESNLSNQKDTKVYSNIQKYYLKKEMYNLFRGSKEEKLKALNIASKLSDKSTLNILRIGLKDMDSDIVKLSAKLIENFK